MKTKLLPLFVMRRRIVLPGGTHTLHLVRESSFRRLDEAFSQKREVFVATASGDGSVIERVGVVAHVASFGRIPAPRGVGGTEDRVVLHGVHRARVRAPGETSATAREVEVDAATDAVGEVPTGVAITSFEATLASIRARHLSGARRAAEIDALPDPIARVYALAVEEEVRSPPRQALLEAEGAIRKMEILRNAFLEELDGFELEARILRRVRPRSPAREPLLR